MKLVPGPDFQIAVLGLGTLSAEQPHMIPSVFVARQRAKAHCLCESIHFKI